MKMADSSDNYVRITVVKTPVVNDEVAHKKTESDENDDNEADMFNVDAESGQSSRFDTFDLCDTFAAKNVVVDPQYTIGKIPELCEQCFAIGERNVAVKMCATCKKQICKSCEDTHNHLEALDQSDREIRAFVEDDDDGQYTVGKIPELCVLCIASGERNAAVNMCTTCKKQVCKFCKHTHKHQTSDPSNREIGVIVEDADDDEYTIGKIPDLCELCIVEGEQRMVVKYCMSCKKHICKLCVDAHKRFKVLMSHAIVATESHKSNNQLRNTKCEQHEKKDLDRFYINHKIFCCVVCAVKHTECAVTTNMADIESVSKRALTFVKEKYQHIETHMEKVRTKNIESRTDFRNKIDNLKRLLEDRKQNIENALKVILRNFDAESKQLLSFTDKEIESSIEEIDEVKFLCRTQVEKIDNILEAGHPVHVVAMHNVVIDEYQKTATDIDNTDIKQKTFECRLNLSKLHCLYEDLVAQADEKIKIAIRQVCLPKCEDIVNVLHNRKVIRTNQHKIRPVLDCTPKYSNIAAINGGKHLVLTDCCDTSSNCGNVCLYDIRNRLVIKQKLNRPFGIAVLRFDHCKIAVSLPFDKQILIISTMEKCLTTVKAFEVDKVPLCLVSLDNGCIGATFHSPLSFDFIDVSGKHIKTLKSYTKDSTGRIFKSFGFVAIDEFRSHIIQPCQEENAVYSFDYSGHPVFEYRDTELRSPQGVGLDQYGNVYICSFFNHMLHVLAPTGNKIRYVTTGVPSSPCAICFDETGKSFWISSTAAHNLETLHVFSLRE